MSFVLDCICDAKVATILFATFEIMGSQLYVPVSTCSMGIAHVISAYHILGMGMHVDFDSGILNT